MNKVNIIFTMFFYLTKSDRAQTVCLLLFVSLLIMYDGQFHLFKKINIKKKVKGNLYKLNANISNFDILTGLYCTSMMFICNL